MQVTKPRRTAATLGPGVPLWILLHVGHLRLPDERLYNISHNKSPLKVVLEGVTSRQPDWRVGEMVKKLRLMERNDAIAILARLRPDAEYKYHI